MLIDLPVALPPLVELAAADLQPANEALHRQLRLGGEVAHEINHLVAYVVGDPACRQGPPRDFFSCTYSSEISAMMLSLRASFASKAATFCSSSCSRREDPCWSWKAR